MRIDWTNCETGDLVDIADGLGEAGQQNFGLPFALVLIAMDRAEAQGFTRGEFVSQLHTVVAEYQADGAQNA